MLLFLLLRNGLLAFPKGYDEGYLVAPKIEAGITVDSIVVNKAVREMLVFSKGEVVMRYTVCLGLNPVGPKQVQGDYKTPEGLYFINVKIPNSLFHRGLGISYPNKQDVARAKTMGKSPGGDIIIHGLPNNAKYRGPENWRSDWTWGCIALRDEEIDDLFQHVAVGTPILINP